MQRNEYIALAMKYKPLNLGQGFPDDEAPEHVTKALVDVAGDPNPLLQQYTRGHVRIIIYFRWIFISTMLIYFWTIFTTRVIRV